MSRQPVKCLFYAINGTGLGHLSRLLNLARMARELLHAMALRADFQFLTTSEAPQIAWDFPVYKLPSKTTVAQTDAAHKSFVANAKFLISNLVAIFRPDILILDTIPEGSFQEFFFLKDYAQARVFVDRHKDQAYALSASQQSHLALYDLILVPDEANNQSRYPLPETLVDRRRFVGPIHGYQAETALTPEQVRQQFGVLGQQEVVYVSSGGGGDKQAEQELQCLVDTLRTDAKLFLLVGYGPLYRGKRIYAHNVIPLTDPAISRFFSGVDFAICAAGYNTYHELLAAGVPTAFYAQKKGMDRQDERIRLGQKQGWHHSLAEISETAIRRVVAELRNRSYRTKISDALSVRPATEGALRGAVELLKLHATLSRSPIDRRVLVTAAQRQRRWPEVAQTMQKEQRIATSVSFAQAYQSLQAWETTNLSQLSLEAQYEQMLLQWQQVEAGIAQPSQADIAGLRWGANWAHWQTLLGFSSNEALYLMRAFTADVQGQGATTIDERQALIEVILDHLLTVYPAELVARLLKTMRQALKPDAFVAATKALAKLTARLSSASYRQENRIAGLITTLQSTKTRLTLDDFEALLAEGGNDDANEGTRC